MKNLLLISFVTVMLIGTLCAGSHSVLVVDKPKMLSMDGGSFVSPWCDSGNPCSTSLSALAPSDGAPMPVCPPGKNCNNDQPRQIASDGAPMPVCPPGKN